MATKRLCAVSVDLDPLTSYYQIHGLNKPPPQLQHTILSKALPRFEALFQEAGVRATWFCIGQEVERAKEGQEALARLSAADHELGNHTYSHPYHLCKLSKTEIDEEIGRAHETLAGLFGKKAAPVGFRAPGYFINSKVIKSLAEQRYQYDSSMFPSAPYYFAKAAAMAAMTFRGRRSQAMLADPRALTSPMQPYRPDVERPWRRGASSVVELPVAVLPGLRVPAIGTALVVFPKRVRWLMLNGMTRLPFLNLEFHGIDLADATADRIPTELAGRQPDLRVPVADKHDILLQCLQYLGKRFEFVTLKEAAARLV